MAFKTISYFLATLLCLSGCIATHTTTVPQQKITEPTPKPPGHFTYLLRDLWPDPYEFVGSINFFICNTIYFYVNFIRLR